MQIALISTKINPFGDAAHRDTICGPLANALSSAGHSIKIVVPLPREMNPEAHSLARRLNPIEVNTDDGNHIFNRYDGNIMSGVDVYLLEVAETPAAATLDQAAVADLFCRAALACLDSQPEAPACCISFSDGMPLVSNLCRQRQTPNLLILQSLGDDAEALEKGLLEADRVVVLGSDPTQTKEIPDLLVEMLQDGRAVSLPRPADAVKPLSAEEKASKKAAFQMQMSLPVRTDVPVVFFPNPLDSPFIEVLEQLLTRDVQVLVATKNDRLVSLLERYPDRLAISTSDHSVKDHLAIADGCVVNGNPQMISMALCCGTLPVTSVGAGSGLVDLEPNLQSGSGIVIPRLSEDLLAEGLGRFAAAFSNPAYRALSARLPAYTVTWNRMATYCLQLIEELNTDTSGQSS